MIPVLAHYVTERGNNRQDVLFVDDERRLWDQGCSCAPPGLGCVGGHDSGGSALLGPGIATRLCPKPCKGGGGKEIHRRNRGERATGKKASAAIAATDNCSSF